MAVIWDRALTFGMPPPYFPYSDVYCNECIIISQSSLVCKAMGDCLRGRVAHSMEVHSTSIRCYAAEALALWQNENAPVDTSVSISVPGSWLGVKVEWFEECTLLSIASNSPPHLITYLTAATPPPLRP